MISQRDLICQVFKVAFETKKDIVKRNDERKLSYGHLIFIISIFSYVFLFSIVSSGHLQKKTDPECHEGPCNQADQRGEINQNSEVSQS